MRTQEDLTPRTQLELTRPRGTATGPTARWPTVTTACAGSGGTRALQPVTGVGLRFVEAAGTCVKPAKEKVAPGLPARVRGGPRVLCTLVVALKTRIHILFSQLIDVIFFAPRCPSPLVHNATTQDDGDGNESTDSEWTGHRCESAPLCGNLSVASRTAFPLSTCPHECITTGAVALAGDVPFEQAVACTVNPIANRRRPGRQCHGRGIWRMVGAARSRKVYVAASRAARSCGRVAQARSPPGGG